LGRLMRFRRAKIDPFRTRQSAKDLPLSGAAKTSNNDTLYRVGLEAPILYLAGIISKSRLFR
jgi:hypothetical protein